MSHDELQKFELLSWAKDDLILEIVPALGGKIRHLRRRGAQRNLLLESPEYPLRVPDFAQPFADADTSGWDECFPTVGACGLDTGTARSFPDHGDVWSLPATWAMSGGRLTTEVACRSVPCLFRRHLEIEGCTLRVSYEVVSHASEAVPVLWSAHPLLSVSPGSRMFLPSEVKEMRVEWSGNPSQEPAGSSIPWPMHRGRRFDEVAPPSVKRAIKLFSPRLTTGWCAFWDKDTDEHLVFRFDPKTIPFVGLWICEGGWPVDDRPKHYTVAVEPCLADVDSLARAVQEKTAPLLPSGGTLAWDLTLSLGHGLPAPL